MKKLFTMTALILASTATYANTTQVSGGFQGPEGNRNLVTVKQALELKDDVRVDLTGYILESLGDEKYTFKDETGSMTIEIDHDDWNGVTATPETKVVIHGEVDKDMLEDATIDVDTITLSK